MSFPPILVTSLPIKQILQTLTGIVFIMNGLHHYVHSQVLLVVIRHLTNSMIIKSWSNLGVDNRSRPSETISFSPSHQALHSKSSQDQIRSKGISYFPFSSHSHQAFSFIIWDLLLFKKGFQFALQIWIRVSLQGIGPSYQNFILYLSCGSSCCLRARFPHSTSREVVVASRQHSRFIPCLAVASRQQSWSTPFTLLLTYLSILSTAPSLESLLTPWNTTLCDLIIPILRWYPAFCVPTVSYKGKKAACCLQLIALQGIWVGCLDYALESLQQGICQPCTTKE